MLEERHVALTAQSAVNATWWVDSIGRYNSIRYGKTTRGCVVARKDHAASCTWFRCVEVSRIVELNWIVQLNWNADYELNRWIHTYVYIVYLFTSIYNIVMTPACIPKRLK